MRIIRYLLQYKAALAMVVLLFALQATCDLALPAFTSSIVDVGIQQGGIEDGVPEYVSSATYAELTGSVDKNTASQLATLYSYDQDLGCYRLDEDALASAGYSREALASALAAPLVQAAGLTPANDPSLLEQQAIQAVRAEYQLLGIDTTSMQVAYLLRTGAVMLALVVLACVLHIGMNFFATRTGAKIAYNLRQKLFSAVVHFSRAEINRFSAASLITRGTNDIQQIQVTAVMLQRMLIYSVLMAIGGTLCIARTNVSMAWIIVVGIGLVILILMILLRLTLPKFKIMQQLIDKVNLVSREELTGVSVVRAFNRQRYEEDRFAKASGELMGTQLYVNRAMAFMQPGMTFVMNGISVLIVLVGAHYVDLGSVQTGDLIAFITYAMQIIGAFLMLGLVAILLPRAEVAAQRVDEVIATASSIEDPQEPRDAELDERIAQDGVQLEFHDVSFSYPAMAADGEDIAEEPVLSDLTFAVPAGSVCAIVGGTGSGKSTVLRLLMRFFDVSKGSIMVNGIDIRELSQRRVHALFGYVPQVNYLFQGTIASNISYGAPDISDDAINHALAVAQAQSFVADKEGGIQASVSQGGTNFSGGQRQRLAIARALATGAPVLLFDDSFSALDYRTDADLRIALAKEEAGRTCIIVAQRIATIMHADQILVLDDGRIVGKGTHAELMETCAAYREIALSQMNEQELATGVGA